MPRSFPEAEVARAAGSASVGAEPVEGGGYGSNTSRWRVELEDGRRVFVKHALDDLAAAWLRREHHVYAAVSAPFMPELVGWQDGESALLVLEDLGAAHWPPPWRDGDVDERVADAREVPVHEQDAVVAEAEVVAPHVEVDE